MSDDTRTFFEEVADARYLPQLAETKGSYQFNIQGAGSWSVLVDRGAVVVTERVSDADCTMGMSSDDFARVVHGEQNPTTALLQGKVQIAGDLVMLAQFVRLFPWEPPSQERRADTQKVERPRPEPKRRTA